MRASRNGLNTADDSMANVATKLADLGSRLITSM